MKKNYKLLFMGGLVIFLLLLFMLEKPYSLKSSEFVVSGSSTIRDWKMISNNATGEGEFEISNNKIKNIHNLIIKIPSESLKSGNSELDQTAYSTLRTEKYKYITFALNYVKNIEYKNEISHLVATGNLSIAGTTKVIEVQAKGVIENQQVLFTGTHLLKMTDFNLDPPSAVLGTIKADDHVMVTFKVLFIPNNQYL